MIADGLGYIDPTTAGIVGGIISSEAYPTGVPIPATSPSVTIKGVADQLNEFVSENKMWVYAAIGIMGFLAVWRKR